MMLTLNTGWPAQQCGYASISGYDVFIGSMSYADQIFNQSYYTKTDNNKREWRAITCTYTVGAICELPPTMFACPSAPPPSPPPVPPASADNLCESDRLVPCARLQV
jgi:hypothetical protein